MFRRIGRGAPDCARLRPDTPATGNASKLPRKLRLDTGIGPSPEAALLPFLIIKVADISANYLKQTGLRPERGAPAHPDDFVLARQQGVSAAVPGRDKTSRLPWF
jgi:hypothetical protein